MVLSVLRHGLRPVKAPPATDGGTLVRVCGGYSPAVVHARAGVPVRITFLREETASCSERVVFPALGKSTMLPYGKRVVVELPASPPGTYAFTCAMDMLHGTLVLE